MLPSGVNNSQRRITIRQRADNNAHSAYVVHFFYRDVLSLHFAPDAEDVLRPPSHCSFYTVIRKQVAYTLCHCANVLFALLALLTKLFRDAQINVLA